MPYVKDLSTSLQNALLKHVVGPIQVEVILDPDAQNIDLSSYIDGNSSLSIIKRKAIMPYGRIGAFSLGEVKLRMVNRNDYFNHFKKSSPFYYAHSRLFSAKPASQNYIDVPKGDGDKFTGITDLYIREGENSEKYTIVSVDTTTYTDYDRITVSLPGGGTGTIDFNGGALVETEHQVGKKVVLRTTVNGVTDKIDQYVGVLKSLPLLRHEYAELTLQDLHRKLLDTVAKANSYKILLDHVGNWKSTQEYQRTNSSSPSSGTLDMNDVVINSSRCKIGNWEIEFTSPTDFICRDPDNYEMTGTTTADFYFGDSTKYQIMIHSYAWGGTFEKGDKVQFKTTLALGLPENSYDTIPKMIYRLLLENFGAGLTTADIVDADFQDLINKMSGMRGAITFTRSITVLKAIELLQQHINATVYVDNSGKFRIAAYWPEQTPTTIHNFSPDADIMQLESDDYGPVDRAIGYYRYDYDGAGYQNRILIPDEANQQGVKVTLNFPAFYGYGQARATCDRIYLAWRKGMKVYNIREKWNYGLAIDLNEKYKITSKYPDISEQTVEIFEVRKDLVRGTVQLKAFDRNHIYSNYAFTDTSKTDSGAVVW